MGRGARVESCHLCPFRWGLIRLAIAVAVATFTEQMGATEDLYFRFELRRRR